LLAEWSRESRERGDTRESEGWFSVVVLLRHHHRCSRASEREKGTCARVTDRHGVDLGRIRDADAGHACRGAFHGWVILAFRLMEVGSGAAWIMLLASPTRAW